MQKYATDVNGLILKKVEHGCSHNGKLRCYRPRVRRDGGQSMPSFFIQTAKEQSMQILQNCRELCISNFPCTSIIHAELTWQYCKLALFFS